MSRIRAFLSWFTHPLHFTLTLLSIMPIALVIAFQSAYAANLPRGDQLRTFDNAIAAYDGTLQISDFFVAMDGHIQAFTRLQTVIVTWLTGWNLNVEMRVNLALAVVVYLLLIALVYKTHKTAVALALVPLSLMTFAVNQDFMWLVGFSSCWFYTHLFFLTALVAITYFPNNKLAFALAILGATCATFSFGNGMLVWVVILPALWLIGIRHRGYWLAWIIATMLIIGLFLNGSGILSGNESGDVTTSFDIRNISVAIQFTLGYIGSPFVTNDLIVAQRITVIGIVFLLANSIYLLMQQSWSKNRVMLAIWLPIAGFPVLSALMAGINRPDLYPLGITGSLRMQYKTGAGFFWVAVFVIGIVAIQHLIQHEKNWRRVLVFINIAAAVSLFFVYTLANYRAIGGEEWHWLQQIKQHDERCYVRFIFTQDIDRMEAEDCLVWGGLFMNDLAIREMAMFKDYPRTMIIPGYHGETPILVEGDNEWISRHIVDWLLADAPENAVSVITPDARPAITSDSVWVVRRADFVSPVTDFWQALEADGYIGVDSTHTIPEGMDFTMTRYERVPADIDEVVRFGEHIALPMWVSVTGNIQACETVDIKTVWQADEPSDVPLSMTMTLLNATGEAVARTDSQLSLVESNLWEAGKRYLDARVLTLPCELVAGNYQLGIGVYDWRDGSRLVAILPDGDVAPENLAIVEMLQIE